MEILLDLLPEERKKELSRSRLFRKTIWIGAVFLFPIFVMLAILADNLYVLNYEKESTAKIYAQELGQDQFKKVASFQNSFKNANDLASGAINFQSKHLHWTNVLNELSKIIPDNVTITDISTKDFQVIFIGNAKTRDDLLKLQSALKESDCFQDVNVPLSDMVQKNDIGFQVDFDVKKDCLTKKI